MSDSHSALRMNNGHLMPLILTGRPGIGKTSMARSLAADDALLVKIDMGTKDFTDFGTYPVPNVQQRLIEHLLSEESIIPLLASHIGARSGVLILDDVTASDARIQSSLLGLMTDYRIGGHELGANVHLVLTGNEPRDGAYAAQWSQSILSRGYLIRFEPDFDAWINYADNLYLAPEVITFLKSNPEFFAPDDSEGRYSDEYGRQPNPRAWTGFGAALAQHGGVRRFTSSAYARSVAQLAFGMLSARASEAFCAFADSYQYPTPDELLEDASVWQQVPAERRKLLAGALGVVHGLRGRVLQIAQGHRDLGELATRYLDAVAVIEPTNHELHAVALPPLLSYLKAHDQQAYAQVGAAMAARYKDAAGLDFLRTVVNLKAAGKGRSQ